MRKKGIALLAALLLALLAGCGANGAAQPEQIDKPAVDPNLSPTAAFMAALQEDEVTKVALCGGQLAAASPEQMWKALNNAATHEITESEACYDLGYSVSGCQWEVTVSVPADVLRLSCGLAENVVVVQSERLSAVPVSTSPSMRRSNLRWTGNCRRCWQRGRTIRRVMTAVC